MPHYLSLGLSEDKIDNSCPTDLKPYVIAFENNVRLQDRLNWISGLYHVSAVGTALGGKDVKYIEKPLLAAEEETKQMTELDKKKQTEQLFLQLKIMGMNFQNTHKNKGGSA